ncbi:hypothetical protein ABES33_23675 [Bacillus pseudomycoides]|uniref:hypothetical protein n=1 Tax=Bacillus pseudomycoides TaxID=64104 RepID=UPI003D1DD5FE
MSLTNIFAPEPDDILLKNKQKITQKSTFIIYFGVALRLPSTDSGALFLHEFYV